MKHLPWILLALVLAYPLFAQGSNTQFVAYVRGLLDVCNLHAHELQQEQFNEVLRHERDFWKMTWEG